MKKLILSSFILLILNSNAFAFVCPRINQVVNGVHWSAPNGWTIYSEAHDAIGILSMVEVNANRYGDVRCKYKSKEGWLEILDTEHLNMLLKFDGSWNTGNQFHYMCLCEADNEKLKDCSYELEFFH